MNNFKKAAALLLVVIFAASLCVSAFAAPSPSIEADVADIITDASVEGLPEGIRIIIGGKIADEDAAQAVEALKDDPAAVLEALELDPAELVVAAGVKAVNADDEEVEITSAVTVKLTVAGVEDGDVVTILQLIDGEWTQIEASVEDGQIVFVLEQLSPIAIYVAE